MTAEEIEAKLAKAMLWVLVLCGLVFAVVSMLDAAPTDKIVWSDSDSVAFLQELPEGQVGPPFPRYGVTRVTNPGEAGTPIAFTEPPTQTCSLSQKDRIIVPGKWRCRCIGGKCYQAWIAPPPTVPCERTTEPKVQFGYTCSQGLDGIAGWQGDWRGAVRPQ